MAIRSIARQATVPGFANAKSAPIYVDSDDNRLKMIPAGSGTTEVILQETSGSGASEVVITTRVLTAVDSGKVCYLSLAGGFTVTLPPPALGLSFKFIVKTAPTTAYIITTDAGANLIYGMFEERAGGAGVAGAAQDTQNFVANQAIIADWAEYYSDGTNWYVRGMVNVAAGVTFAVT